MTKTKKKASKKKDPNAKPSSKECWAERIKKQERYAPRFTNLEALNLKLNGYEVPPNAILLGTPSAFKPEYCQMLVEHMSKGFSLESFAGVVGHHRQAILTWISAIDKFQEAYQLGKAKSLLFWEAKGIEGLFNETYGGGVSKTLNAPVWRLNMINRFKWKDRAEDDKNIKIDVASLSDEEIMKLAKELLDEHEKNTKAES